MSAKRKHRSANAYLKYLKGELSREERHSFERDLEADPFEKEAMEGMELYAPGEVEEDLLSLHATLGKRLKKRRRRTYLSIAASIASLLIVGTVFVNIYDFSPRSAEETIPRDESFLHEEAVGEAETPVEERLAAPVQEQMPSEEDMVETKAVVEAPLETINAEEKDLAKEKEIAIHEEEAVAEEAAAEEIPAPEGRVVQGEYAKAAQVEELMMADEAEAGEVVAVEAAPRTSQKKERAKRLDEATSVPAPAQVLTERMGGIVVSSEDMEPLPGACIVLKGNDSGMVADMEGRFILEGEQQGQATVIASFVGMETNEYQLGRGIDNQVVMQPDAATLDEVVVVAYGAEKELKEERIFNGAYPVGGIEAYKLYMEENIRFPTGDTISKRGIVVLKFTVEADGTISDLRTLRSPGDAFTETAKSLLREGPSWYPAKDESGATNDVVRMRIVFKR